MAAGFTMMNVQTLSILTWCSLLVQDTRKPSTMHNKQDHRFLALPTACVPLAIAGFIVTVA
jgi:hypothetical protein